MRKSILSSLASLALVVSMNANASHKDGNNLPVDKAGDVVHAGVNVVINVGNLVVSFSDAALKAFPALAGHATDLVKCLSDRMDEVDGEGVTAPVLCPVMVGTEMVTAIILTGVSGVQEVIAVPSKFAKDIAAIMLDTSKRSWDAMEAYSQIPGFFLVQLGVCVASQVIGRAAQAGAWVLDTVSTVAGKAVELVVDGVRTGIKYASDAVVILTDAALDRVAVLGNDAYGAAKSLVVTLVKAAHGNVGGNDGAIKSFLDNFVGRLVTLPVRIVMNESFEEMTARVAAESSTCDMAVYEASGACH